MLHIAQDANLHTGAGQEGQLYGATETLVTLGVIVLKTNLQLNCLLELAGLVLTPLEYTCSKSRAALQLISYQASHTHLQNL